VFFFYHYVPWSLLILSLLALLTADPLLACPYCILSESLLMLYGSFFACFCCISFSAYPCCIASSTCSCCTASSFHIHGVASILLPTALIALLAPTALLPLLAPSHCIPSSTYSHCFALCFSFPPTSHIVFSSCCCHISSSACSILWLPLFAPAITCKIPLPLLSCCLLCLLPMHCLLPVLAPTLLCLLGSCCNSFSLITSAWFSCCWLCSAFFAPLFLMPL